MKKKLIFSIIASSILIIGCGENSSISDSDVKYNPPSLNTIVKPNVNYSNYIVEVYDDKILNASVTAPECNSTTELEDGRYLLENCVTKPKYILAVNGKIKDTNITQTFPLVLNTSQTNKDDNFVITPFTTLVADVNNTEEIKNLAKKVLGVDSLDKVYNKPDNNQIKNLRKINAIMLKATSDGVVANKLKFIETLRDSIKTNNDFNITKIASDVAKKSQENPALFGLVFIDLKSNNDDNLLKEIEKAQNPKNIQLFGLVFDDKISDANITIKWADNNKIFVDGITTGNDGNWSVELNSTLKKELEDNKDKILIIEATKGKIKLTSTLSAKEILEKAKLQRKITPTINPNLIVSNITTVENAILEKREALKDLNVYENNITEIKTYYTDKVLKTSAVLKDIVDNNKADNLNTDTYTYILDNIVDAKDVNLSDEIKTKDTTEMENNISQNAILKMQLNNTNVKITNNVTKDKFEEAAINANNIFYRLLAYYDNNTFVREYDKIVVYPGLYQITKCYIYNDDTREWNCNAPIKIYNANFNNGKYTATGKNGIVYTYSLDSNDSIYVKALNKSYNIYDVTKKELIANEITSSIPIVLVDNFDIVDMYRRMPKEDKESFKNLKDIVEENGKTGEKVNYALNRFVRDSIEDVEKYFKEEQ